MEKKNVCVLKLLNSVLTESKYLEVTIKMARKLRSISCHVTKKSLYPKITGGSAVSKLADSIFLRHCGLSWGRLYASLSEFPVIQGRTQKFLEGVLDPPKAKTFKPFSK